MLSLQKKVIRIYTQVYQYQIGLVRQYSRHLVVRRLRDIGAIDGWQNKLADITELNTLIEGDIQVLMNHRILTKDQNVLTVLESVSNIDGRLNRLLSEAEQALELQKATFSVAQVLLPIQARNLVSLMLFRMPTWISNLKMCPS